MGNAIEETTIGADVEDERQTDSPRFKDVILENGSLSSSDNEDMIGETGNAGFALELEDEQDEDFIYSILEPLLPNGIHFTTLKDQSEIASKNLSHIQFIFLEKSFPLSKTTHNIKQQQQYIASLFRELYITLSFKLLLFANEELSQSVYVMGITEKIRFNNANDFTITLQAMPVLVTSPPKADSSLLNQLKSNLPKLYPPFPYPQVTNANEPINSPRRIQQSPLNKSLQNSDDMLFNMDMDQKEDSSLEEVQLSNPNTSRDMVASADIDREWLEG